jgi:hypothetical protein
MAAAAVGFFMLVTRNTTADTRYMVFACVFCEVAHVGALVYFLAWVTTVNRTN